MIKRTEPFNYWVIEGFLPDEMAQDAYDWFFDGDGQWISRHHLYSRYKRTRTTGLAWPVEQALRYMESDIICATLEKLTGIRPLESDPDRFGGGQHVTGDGGSLGIHADFTHHPKTGKRRALNMLLYLNKKNDCFGGELELWDANVKNCVVAIRPVFNRAVLFETSTTSFHGHPDPLVGERRSLAAYYYTQDKPGTWQDYLKTTDYRPRPWEYGLRLRRWASRFIKGGN